MKAITVFDPIINNNIGGQIIFEQEDIKVKIDINLHGFEPNHTYAIHIHEYGDMSDGCKSLGAHFNPMNMNHGSEQISKDCHSGDLMNNISSDSNGDVKVQYTTSNISIKSGSKKCIIGRSVVIHDYPDDMGQKGLIINGNFKSYSDMKMKELKEFSIKRGYPKIKTRKELINKLEMESLSTGNAGKRMACAIIGIMNQKK